MCGIAGIIGSRASVEIARSMAQRLRHRGPDGEGTWSQPGVALAHRRLAILDLSEGGHQPMSFDSQVLTYNGEIYNHESLRAGLPGPWHSTGDTEVLVHLLAKQGSACLGRLVGMFAFAAWDTREQLGHQTLVPAAARRHCICL
jgi:asparagine synthase (glutamine-hydrolysing)